MSRLDGNAYFVVIGLALLPILLGAKTRTNFDHADIVDYVEGEKLGILEVKLIPKDASRATVVLKNHSQKPIRIQLPSAFAGVPVLAQADDFGAPLGDDGLGPVGSKGSKRKATRPLAVALVAEQVVVEAFSAAESCLTSLRRVCGRSP